jgi:hypothetical protein
MTEKSDKDDMTIKKFFVGWFPAMFNHGEEKK